MLVKDWMSKNIVTVGKDDSMEHVMRLLKENNIRMLPVVKKDKVIGVVTDRDIKSASASKATTLEIHELAYLISKIKVAEIMTKDPITVPFDYTVEETAEILLKNKINGVPVVDHAGQITGVFTQTDLFKALICLTGHSMGGILFAVKLEDRPGSIKEILDIIQKHSARILSFYVSYNDVQEGFRKVYFRIYGIEPSMLARLKEELNNKTTLLHVVDHYENKREIYRSE